MARMMTGRVTRSQSRGLEDPVLAHDQGRATKWNAVPGKGNGKTARLSSVAENSPVNSRHTSTSAGGTAFVPESPEGNISGTTILPQEDSDPEDDELEPIIMIDELPGLQDAADRLLNLLRTNARDARQVVDAAKKLANPRNTENKRLKPAIRKLISQMKSFGSQRFIDVAEVQHLIPTVKPKDSASPWGPSPALQRANCARLAIDVLLASTGSQSPRETIHALETLFPAPFINEMADGGKALPVGGSTATGATFEMALEIRTQFALVSLETRQKEKGFDARSVLESVFYGDGQTSDTGFLRGFNLPGTFADENGRLPDRFQDRVSDRFSELEYSLYDDDENLNIRGLKSSFWSRFLVCTARFVQSRDKELRRDLEFQPRLEDVRDDLERLLEEKEHSHVQQTTDQQESEAPGPEADPSTRSQILHEDDEDDEPQDDENELFVRWTTPPISHQPPPEAVERATPSRQNKEPTPKSAHRRRSSKGNDLSRNMDFLQKRREARQQQEKASRENTNGLSNASDLSQSSPSQTTRNAEEADVPREIAQTPEEDLRYPPDDNDDTLLNNNSDLDLGNHRRIELMQSTSPPGSERTRQNYNRGRFFDHPPPNESRPINGQEQRRTLLDEQENRTRVNWTSEEESQLTEKGRPQLNTTYGDTAKRPRSEMNGDSDDDSDDAFEQPKPKKDNSFDLARRRLQQPNKRQRLGTDEEAAADQLQGDLNATRDTHRAQKQISALPASTQVRSPAPESSRMTHARTQALEPSSQGKSRWSQANDLTSTIAAVPVANMRRRWTADENERLITLIGRYGTGWAEIKSQDDICPQSDGGPKLQGRTQVNLKDRARNMKRAYEREGTPLPRNFEFIKA